MNDEKDNLDELNDRESELRDTNEKTGKEIQAELDAFEEQARAEQEEYERWVKEIEETPKWEVTLGNEYELGIRLQELVDKKNYDAVIGCFDKLHLREGGKMEVQLYDPQSDEAWENAGAPSYVVITTPDGKTYRNTEDEFWLCLSAENTIETVWQIVMLDNLWYYLPMYWHAAYQRKEFIYTQEQLQELQEGYKDSKRAAGFATMEFDIEPRILVDEKGQYYASVCHWTIFGGLYRRKFVIEIDEDNHASIVEYGNEHLFHYKTGIML